MYVPKLSHLRFFCAVVENGSVAAAAKHMNCVASNITMRLKELEADLGQQLFTREKKSLTLTPAGRLLYKEAHEIVVKAERLPSLWSQPTTRGILKIGALDVAFLTCLKEKLPYFIKDYPNIEINLIKRASFVLERMVSDKEIDLAITDGPVINTQLESTFAFHQPLYLIIPHGLKTVSAQKIAESDFFLFSADCFYRQCAERWLEQKSYKPKSVQTIESYEVIMACLTAGKGFSCMPESVVAMLKAGGHKFDTLRLDAIGPTDVYFVWRRQAASAMLMTFIEYMKNERDI